MSGIPETNVQLRPQLPQTSRTFFSSNTNSKRPRRANLQTNDGIYSVQQCHNQSPPHLTQNSNKDNQQLTIAACRYFTSRYPFSLFSVVFTQEVREKLVIDDLIKYAMDKSNFALKTVAYRRGKSENNEHRILIFVENRESFAYLYENGNWPSL